MNTVYWTFKFYYAGSEVGQHDVYGDHAIAHLLCNIFRAEQNRQIKVDFMRYSVNGYHLVLKLRGDKDDIEYLRQSVIIPNIKRYKEQYPELIDQQNLLSGYTQVLYERLSLEKKGAINSGNYEFEQRDEQLELYESKLLYDTYVDFADISSRATAELIQQGITKAQAKPFVRLLLFDLLEQSDMRMTEKYYVAYFSRHQWEAFFKISEETLRACQLNYDKTASNFHEFISKKQGVEGSLQAIPIPFKARYQTFYNLVCKLFNQLIYRDEHGELTNQSALRLLSFMHLMHNRLGLGIDQEVLFSLLLTSYWGKNLTESECDLLERSSKMNVSNYLDGMDNSELLK